MYGKVLQDLCARFHGKQRAAKNITDNYAVAMYKMHDYPGKKCTRGSSVEQIQYKTCLHNAKPSGF